MGLFGWCRKELRRRYREEFVYKNPENIGCVCIDMMQFVKGVLPDNIKTLDDLIPYLIFQAVRHLRHSSILAICFDGDSPEPKSMVDHVKRKDWRCGNCKKTDSFSPLCKKKCEENKPFEPKDGPFMSLDTGAPLPDWKRFSLHTQNLRNELYPRLYNAFLNYKAPAGKLIFLQKFPTKMESVKTYSNVLNTTTFNRDDSVTIPVPWKLPNLKSELEKAKVEDPKLWNRVVCLQNGNCYVDDALENDIKEADNAVFFFSQFYPQINHMSIINDGDAYSIGLFRVIENIKDGAPIHDHWLCMPYKVKYNRVSKDAKWEYVNLTSLHRAVEADPAFKNVANPTATLVFLMILAGTDFFQNYCPGIGFATEWKEEKEKRDRQRNGIWDTFFAHIEMFTHMVQWNCYEMVADPTVERRIVIDEDLFILFTNYCYLEKYGASVKERINDEYVNMDMVTLHCSKKLKDPLRRVPKDDKVRLKCRHVTWNLQYWVNAFRNIYIDPFETKDGMSYYGFSRKGLATRVCASQKPVDEAYKRHFHKRVSKKAIRIRIPKKTKSLALKKIQGKI